MLGYKAILIPTRQLKGGEKEPENSPGNFELKDDLNKDKLTRREFLRFATLLGMSAVSASQMAGLAFPTKAFAAKNIKRGGTLRVASPVTRAKHPSRFDAFGEANMLRQVAEYLTYWDNENITHPYLLEGSRISKRAGDRVNCCCRRY